MATFTVNFQAPTIYVPANFTLEVTPAEAQQLLAEVAPLMAGNITIGNFVSSFPGVAAIIQALQTNATQTATVTTPGTAAPPLVSPVTL